MTLTSTATMIQRIETAIDKMTLSDDAKTKYADLKKDYEPKLKDALDKVTGVLTDAQKKALEDGKKKINEADPTDFQARGQAMQDLNTALALTDDQRTKLNDANTAYTTLATEARTKFRDILTDAQKTEFDQAVPAGRGGPGRGRGRGGRGGGGGGGNGGGGGGAAAVQST
jgi:hypothetical protein